MQACFTLLHSWQGGVSREKNRNLTEADGGGSAGPCGSPGEFLAWTDSGVGCPPAWRNDHLGAHTVSVSSSSAPGTADRTIEGDGSAPQGAYPPRLGRGALGCPVGCRAQQPTPSARGFLEQAWPWPHTIKTTALSPRGCNLSPQLRCILQTCFVGFTCSFPMC